MPDLDSLALFMGASLALNVTPGPDMLYVVARSTGEGRMAGVVSALGIGAGTLVHITALALGLSALLAAVPLAYDAVRWAGAAYLVWLGVRAIRDARRGGGAAAREVPRAPLAVVFRQGVVTNVLNPKVALFFLAFLPQFVDRTRGSAAAQIVALGLLFDTSGTIVNVAVALGASRAAERVRRRPAASDASDTGADELAGRRRGVALRVLTGVVFIGLGVRLALLSAR